MWWNVLSCMWNVRTGREYETSKQAYIKKNNYTRSTQKVSDLGVKRKNCVHFKNFNHFKSWVARFYSMASLISYAYFFFKCLIIFSLIIAHKQKSAVFNYFKLSVDEKSYICKCNVKSKGDDTAEVCG